MERYRFRRRRGTPRHLAVGTTLLAVAVAAGCAPTVEGSAEPEPLSLTGDMHPPGPRGPAESVLPPDRFPARYPAVVLPPEAVAQAAPDLTGIPTGAKVDPPGCLPPAQDYGPAGTAMVVGTDNDSRATLTVEVVAAAAPLPEFRTFLAECAAIEATHRGVTATVTTAPEPPPAPPVAGVDTLAFTRTVRSGPAGGGITQHMQTRLAQAGEMRILVTYMAFDERVGDPAALDEVFTAAVVYATGG